MLTGHLFAGAGGGLYADLILGHRPIFAVEWERYPAAVLQQRADEGWFPGLRVHNEDIRLFDPSEYAGRVDSLHAGFPCQDISVAGNGSGITGERSGLWSEVIRCADAIRPAELFLENSPAITSRGLDRVLSDLAALGFDAEWCCLPAAAVGAPHRRDRWWCLARRSDADNAGQLPDSRSGSGGESPETRHDARRLCVDVADTKCQRQQEPRKVVRPSNPTTNREREADIAVNGLWWATEPKVGRVAHGVAHRGNRIKALGNGQVPLQAAMAYTILDARHAA